MFGLKIFRLNPNFSAGAPRAPAQLLPPWWMLMRRSPCWHNHSHELTKEDAFEKNTEEKYFQFYGFSLLFYVAHCVLGAATWKRRISIFQHWNFRWSAFIVCADENWNWNWIWIVLCTVFARYVDLHRWWVQNLIGAEALFISSYSNLHLLTWYCNLWDFYRIFLKIS